MCKVTNSRVSGASAARFKSMYPAAIVITPPTSPATSDYPTVGGSYTNQRYSALDQINATNISKLGGAWSIHIEDGPPVGNLDGTPVVINGVM